MWDQKITEKHLFNLNQEQVYRARISDFDKLKRRINSEWAALSHAIIKCDNVEFIFDRQEAKYKLAQFSETQCIYNVIECM